MEAVSWIAAQVIANREISISSSLNSKGYETFVPTYSCKRQWSDRTKVVRNALLSGYVLVRQASRMTHGPIVTTPGVLGIVGFGNQPALIDDAEIAQFRIVANASVRAEPWPTLEEGDRVTIAHGPLAGIAGTVLQTRNKSLHHHRRFAPQSIRIGAHRPIVAGESRNLARCRGEVVGPWFRWPHVSK